MITSKEVIKSLWYSYPELGPNPFFDTLFDFEFNNPKFRYHTMHQLEVFLTGLYFFDKCIPIQQRILDEIDAENDSVGIQEFIRRWTVCAIYQNIGYVFENEHESTDAAWEQAREVINRTFSAPLSILPLFKGKLSATSERQIIEKNPKLFDHRDVKFDSKVDFLDLIADFGLKSGLGISGSRGKSPLRSYYEYALSHEFVSSNRPRFRDHGVESAMLLISTWTSYFLYILRVSDNPLLNKAISDIISIKEQMHTCRNSVLAAAGAIALHNIDPLLWDSSDTIAYSLTIDKFCIRLTDNNIERPLGSTPMAFLLRLADMLQRLDRHRFRSFLSLYDAQNIDMFMHATENKIFLRFLDDDKFINPSSEPSSLYSKTKKALIQYLEPEAISNLLACGDPTKDYKSQIAKPSNKFVDFINQFYSQNISQNAGYSELTKHKLEGISLKITSIIKDEKDEKVDVLILTGNAGDGKTHLCEEIYHSLTGKKLPNRGIVKSNYKNRPFWIIKDASEIDSDKLKQITGQIEKYLSSEPKEKKPIFVLAGNEGKLSEAFLKNNNNILQDTLRNALHTRYNDEEPPAQNQANLKVINFNWRTLTDKNTFNSILGAFLKKKNWEKKCKNCMDYLKCPFIFNVKSLRYLGTHERIRSIFNFFHYMEGHFTLRELFSALSYVITGGLSCNEVHEKIRNNDQINYTFYNNIFSRHNLFQEYDVSNSQRTLPQDRILKEIQKYDVAYAPITEVNWAIVKQLKKENAFSDASDDLHWFSKLNKDQKKRLYIHDALKRRLFFLPDKSFWQNNSDIVNVLSTPSTKFLPFAGYEKFDNFMSEYSENAGQTNEEVKTVIIKGLNLMANRNDPEPEIWLKVYKPYQIDTSINLELIGDMVETLDISLSTECPSWESEYLEFKPTRLALTVKLNDEDNDPVRLPVNLELYELLISVASGSQSQQSFGELRKIIEDFRETLYYRMVKNIKRIKYNLNSPNEKDMDYPLQLIIDNNQKRIILRR
ncbi:MAG: hypothetical protein GY795_49790 [Desulfobacterales bacterium]|nr:hypothetical protein [Desulfobacterales bacterium]